MTRRQHLESLLADYSPLGEQEQVHLTRMRDLLRVPGDPFAGDHYVPGHFTASGFVLSPDGDALYFIHHKKLNRWLQPGGHVEPEDNDVLAAAQRELAEEIHLDNATLAAGFSGVFDVDVHRLPARGAAPAHEHFDIRFLFQAPALDAVRAGDEVNAGRWLALDEITAEATEESIARARRKLHAR